MAQSNDRNVSKSLTIHKLFAKFALTTFHNHQLGVCVRVHIGIKKKDKIKNIPCGEVVPKIRWEVRHRTGSEEAPAGRRCHARSALGRGGGAAGEGAPHGEEASRGECRAWRRHHAGRRRRPGGSPMYS